MSSKGQVPGGHADQLAKRRAAEVGLRNRRIKHLIESAVPCHECGRHVILAEGVSGYLFRMNPQTTREGPLVPVDGSGVLVRVGHRGRSKEPNGFNPHLCAKELHGGEETAEAESDGHG